MYITITQAATLLRTSYGAARDELARSGMLDFQGPKARILVEKFERRFSKRVPESWFKSALKKSDLVPLRELVKHLPFFGGMILSKEALLRLIKYGEYTVKNINHCDRYRLAEFTDPDSWATEEEKGARQQYEATKAEGLGRLAEVLREKRLGLKRAVGAVSPEAFDEYMNQILKVGSGT